MGGEGSGHHLLPVIRRLIFHYYQNYTKTPAEIQEMLFNLSSDYTITQKYLHDLCKRFDQFNSADLEEYLNGSRERGRRKGRPTNLSQDDKAHLRSILRERSTRKLREIAEELDLRIDNEIGHMYSVSTIHRVLRSMKFTRKVIIFLRIEYR